MKEEKEIGFFYVPVTNKDEPESAQIPVEVAELIIFVYDVIPDVLLDGLPPK